MDDMNTRGKKRSERGATTVEYGLMLAGFAAVIVLPTMALNGKIPGVLSDAGQPQCGTVGHVEGEPCRPVPTPTPTP